MSFIVISVANGAPIPATSSSALVSEKPGIFYSAHGFRLDAGTTAWVQSSPPQKIPSLVTVYKSPMLIDGQQPALTVRVDQLRQTVALKNYVKKYMQDYSRFGLDVLNAKSIKINDSPAFALEMVSPESKKQLMQVVFLRDKTAVILTCRDQRRDICENGGRL